VILPALMPEGSTTPVPAQLTWRMFEGISFEGTAAVRGFVEEWREAFEDHLTEAQAIIDLGQRVAFARIREVGRPGGSDAQVQQLRGWVLRGAQGKIERVEPYFDIDEARAAAERLANERA
jgi:ketosteroid isomerase-like protein